MGTDSPDPLAHDNEVARTPPMGWNTFEAFVGEYDDATLRGNIDAVAATGLRDLGYKYFNLDGGWWQYVGGTRDVQGNINVATSAGCEGGGGSTCLFYANGKAGVKALADYARSHGFKRHNGTNVTRASVSPNPS